MKIILLEQNKLDHTAQGIQTRTRFHEVALQDICNTILDKHSSKSSHNYKAREEYANVIAPLTQVAM